MSREEGEVGEKKLVNAWLRRLALSLSVEAEETGVERFGMVDLDLRRDRT